VKPFELGPVLAPRSIAIVGASESHDSWAPEIERSLRHLGFTGDLSPLNPKYEHVWGRPCLSSVAELPRGVDRRLSCRRVVAGRSTSRGGWRAGVMVVSRLR
jgi:acyl-CoA synthetase (NDP forming)